MNICKKCLIRDMAEKSYTENLKSYMQRIDENIKVSEQEYEKRLSICKQCESLLSGMCLKCGCYVELREMKKKQKCPNIPNKW